MKNSFKIINEKDELILEIISNLVSSLRSHLELIESDLNPYIIINSIIGFVGYNLILIGRDIKNQSEDDLKKFKSNVIEHINHYLNDIK